MAYQSNTYPNTTLNGESSPNESARQTPNTDNDSGASFQLVDLVVYLRQIIRFWYLFVIGITIALVVAHYKNKHWIPNYATNALVMIDENKIGNNYLMQGFGLQQSYRNVNNQIIMFGSRDLIRKTINKLPFRVNCYQKGRYKTTSIYGYEPVRIIDESISPLAYNGEFHIKDDGDRTYYTVTWTQNEIKASKKGKYGVSQMFPFGTIKVEIRPEQFMPGYDFYFRFENTEQLIDYYSSRLSFDFVMKGSSVLTVNMQGPDYAKDIDFINQLCDEFIQMSLDRKNEAAIKTIDFIDSQLGSITDSLEISEGNLKNYRLQNDIIDINSYTSQIVSEGRSYESKMDEFEMKEKYFQYLLKILNNNTDEEVIAVPTSIGITDANLSGYVSKYNELVMKKKEIGEKNPFHSTYDRQLEQNRQNILLLTNNMKQSLDLEKRELERKTRKNNTEKVNLPDKQSLMSNYERKFKIQDDYYSYLLQKRSESQVQKASNSADNLIVERARVIGMTNAGEKSSTKTFYLSIGILIPLLISILKIILNNKIVDKRDVERFSSFYPYFGSIRHTQSKSKIPVLNNPRSGLAESYRVVRTRIEFITKRVSPTTTLVTSTESGDGKTTFALNFAAICAHSKRRTLLIDMDLRKPSLIDRLELPNDKNVGMSNYLIGQVEDWRNLIITDEHYNFDMIYAGTVPPNPGELIRTPKLTELMENLKKEYDHIVIDTSPVGLVADAYALMFNVDANIFIVRSAKTNKNFFKSVLQQLRADQITNLYVVLNDVDQRKISYSNYHEYGRRSYYMKKDTYHNYTQEYFKEDEEENSNEGWWKRTKNKLKEIKREYY